MTTVTVIIAAKNASPYIRRAITSALGDKYIKEIIVVDDGSSDNTSQIVEAMMAQNDIIRLIKNPKSLGPSAARNAAIKQSKCEYISILDADDYFLENRFEKFFNCQDWDIIADNIIFFEAGRNVEIPTYDSNGVLTLNLAEFIDNNISKYGKNRKEWGFLKPVIRKQFLLDHNIKYDEAVKLGEDFDIYCRLLIANARFKILKECGYAAEVRPNSLSASHNSAHLLGLLNVYKNLDGQIKDKDAAKVLKTALYRRNKAYQLAKFLEEKNEKGWGFALKSLAGNAVMFVDVIVTLILLKIPLFRHTGTSLHGQILI